MKILRPFTFALLTLFALFTLAGCSNLDPAKYLNEKPALDMKSYFNGTLEGYGMFQDRSGQVKRRFVVLLKASWVGDTGTLDEEFIWSDGKKERRVWTLNKISANRYEGRADDVIGKAEGVVSGNALHWKYVLKLTVDNTTYEVDFDDRMYLIDDKVMLNRAVMSKFGFRLGEVFISFIRR